MSDTDPYAAAEAAPNALEARVFDTAPEPVEDAPEATTEAVPEGPAKDVLAWVGEDLARAEQALEAEKAGQKRSTLMTKLDAIIKG